MTSPLSRQAITTSLLEAFFVVLGVVLALAATETGALSAMDYQTVLGLSKVYAQQERYTHQATGVGQAIYGELLQGGTQSIVDKHTNLTALIYTFVYREIQLISLYDETLATLSSG